MPPGGDVLEHERRLAAEVVDLMTGLYGSTERALRDHDRADRHDGEEQPLQPRRSAPPEPDQRADDQAADAEGEQEEVRRESGLR